VEQVSPSGLVGGGLSALFEVLEPLGRGGQASVYKARRQSDGLLVALKIPPGTMSGMALDAVVPMEAYDTFAREAQHWRRLKHPNIVEMLEAGDRPIPWIAMELMEGGDLRARLRGGPLRLGETLEVSVPLFDALAFAHMDGIYHRDLKPENILFHKTGTPKITDWGMAAPYHSFSRLTEFAGTLPYLAPERLPESLTGSKTVVADRQTDLFSMGIVLYEMLTGRYPFTDDGSLPTTANLNFLDHLKDPAWMPPPPSSVQPSLPAAIDQVMAKLLIKERGRRYELAEHVKRDLEELRRWL
jgi:serine/threonine protein kinase